MTGPPRRNFHLTCPRCKKPFDNYEDRGGRRIYCRQCATLNRKEQLKKNSRKRYQKNKEKLRQQRLALNAIALIADAKIRQEEHAFNIVLDAWAACPGQERIKK